MLLLSCFADPKETSPRTCLPCYARRTRPQETCHRAVSHSLTRMRRNMKNAPMLPADKISLRKRSLIETVNDRRKYISQIEHAQSPRLNKLPGESDRPADRLTLSNPYVFQRSQRPARFPRRPFLQEAALPFSNAPPGLLRLPSSSLPRLIVADLPTLWP